MTGQLTRRMQFCRMFFNDNATAGYALDFGPAESSRPQDGRLFTEKADDCRFETDLGAAAIEYDCHIRSQPLADMIGCCRTDPAGGVRTWRNDGSSNRLQEIERNLVIGDPKGNRLEPGGCEQGDRAICKARHHDGQGSWPEGESQRLGAFGKIS